MSKITHQILFPETVYSVCCKPWTLFYEALIKKTDPFMSYFLHTLHQPDAKSFNQYLSVDYCAFVCMIPPRYNHSVRSSVADKNYLLKLKHSQAFTSFVICSSVHLDKHNEDKIVLFYDVNRSSSCYRNSPTKR